MAESMWLKKLFFPGFNLGVRSRRRVCRFFLEEPSARTLDCGCGNGFFSALAAKKGGTVLAVSFDAAQIERCREYQPNLDCPIDRLEFRVIDAHQIETMTERFDQILLLEVIEHIDDDSAVFAQIARLLKPGGILHLSTPVSRHGRWVGTLDRHDRGGHVRLGYTEDRLQQIVRSSGCDIAYQSRVGGWGVFLSPFQLWLGAKLGDSFKAQGFAFALVYPLFLLLELIPTPYSMHSIHYIIARRPIRETN